MTFILWLYVLFLVCVGLTFLYVIKIVGTAIYKPDCRVPVRDSSKGHHWLLVGTFPVGHYCNVCSLATSHGAQCDYCGILVDRACLRDADKKFTCKPLMIDQLDTVQHHWVKGNLPPGCLCTVCDQVCGDGPGIRDRRCAWCQRTVHSVCAAHLGGVCDFGSVRRIIVPPNCVVLKQLGWKQRRLLVIDHIETERAMKAIPNWCPVIVIANRRSGNGEGDFALQAYRRILNPAQVIDLAEVKPEVGLRWCQLLSGIEFRVLVAGGDGTIGWVLSAVEHLQLSPKPEIGLLPLGTGNDLSRALGWGSGHAEDIDDRSATRVLRQLQDAEPVKLDRWSVHISPRRRFGLRLPDRSLCMSNYFSIGVDAAVTLNFHTTRDTLPRAMSSRFINKMLFFTYGTQDVLERRCAGLSQCVQLTLDGQNVELPALEGIVILNIPTWGAGVVPWPMRSALSADDHEPPQQRIDDGLVEVFGVYSSFHIAQLQVGVGEPYRIGQARHVRIRLFQRAVPMQCDGEPWLQPPAVIDIKRFDQATMLAKPDYAASSPHFSLSGASSPAEPTIEKPRFF